MAKLYVGRLGPRSSELCLSYAQKINGAFRLSKMKRKLSYHIPKLHSGLYSRESTPLYKLEKGLPLSLLHLCQYGEVQEVLSSRWSTAHARHSVFKMLAEISTKVIAATAAAAAEGEELRLPYGYRSSA
ncbi:unnamed protein product [Ceratitis capitata]|uniref:(Mediterranean fruit fly) hypothetical protein n=1 Tax=Ceratitis capitata TaxID=7213 RepID=A0A811VF72_CERCA|nr:unnamed protein product [Ceratitis capitata]